ncbi:GNAT family N-acetyltransferase [Chlamydiota bacterium]
MLQEDSPHGSGKQEGEDPYHITYTDSPSLDDEGVLVAGINEEARLAKKMGDILLYAFFIRDRENTIVGGVKGNTFYGCLYVDSLWVAAPIRREGWGRRLIQASEQLAKERHCTFVSLTTMDWEALPFYLKLGYQVEYVREGFENSSKMYILRKDLT